MALTVTHRKDNTTHQFEWQLMGRPLLSAKQLEDYEYATVFWLQSKTSKSLGIYFIDTETQKDVEALLNPLQQKFIEHCISRVSLLPI